MRTLHVRQHHYQRQNVIKCVAYNAFEGLHTQPPNTHSILHTHTPPHPLLTPTFRKKRSETEKKCAALSNSKERGVAANSCMHLKKIKYI